MRFALSTDLGHYHNFDLSCDLPSISPSVKELLPPAAPVIQETIIVVEPSSSDSSTKSIPQSVSEVISSEIFHRQKLTEQQTEERQLLYLYIQEIENTSNFAQIPNFLRIKH